MTVKPKIAVICFFKASAGGHGSAEVTLSLYKSLNINKRLFEYKESNIKKNFLFNNISKFCYLFFVFFELMKFFRGSTKNIIYIEGASWVGYSYILLVLIKFLLKKSIVVYHAHNVEYDIRLKKNNFFIALLTKYFEKYVYLKSDIATAVSKIDQKRIKKLYNLHCQIFRNGIHSSRLKVSKINNLPKQYYLYSGSYLYNPNKVAIDNLVEKIHLLLIKKYPNLHLIITGKGLPKEIYEKKNILYYKNLDKKKLNYVITKAKFLLLPLKKAPGTKLKIIESLILGTQIITTKNGINGIEIINKNQPYIYKNNKQMINYIKIILKKRNYNKKLLNITSKFYQSLFSMESIVKKFSTNYTK